MDFVSDTLEYGRRLKCLTIVDDFTKESVDIVIDHGISGRYVTRVLDGVAQLRGLPRSIRTDHRVRSSREKPLINGPMSFASSCG